MFISWFTVPDGVPRRWRPWKLWRMRWQLSLLTLTLLSTRMMWASMRQKNHRRKAKRSCCSTSSMPQHKFRLCSYTNRKDSARDITVLQSSQTGNQWVTSPVVESWACQVSQFGFTCEEISLRLCHEYAIWKGIQLQWSHSERRTFHAEAGKCWTVSVSCS